MGLVFVAVLALVLAAVRVIGVTWGPWLLLFACVVGVVVNPVCGILVWVVLSLFLPDPTFHEEACPNCGSRPPIHCKAGPDDFSKCKAPRPGLF